MTSPATDQPPEPSPDWARRLEARIARDGPEALRDLAEALDGGHADRPVLRALTGGDVTARGFADQVDRLLAAAASPGLGAHPTPWRVAAWLARQLAGTGTDRVLDPACGTGHLLIAAALHAAREPSRWSGWDVCPNRVAATRVGLWLAQGRRGAPADFNAVVARDSLTSPTLGSPADVLIMNPPFASIRELVRELGQSYAARLRQRFSSLRGHFDLYLPFLLALPDWIQAGGRFGAIVPATLWTAQYAEPARRRLADRLREVHQLEGRGLFARAAVTAQVVIGGPARARGRIHVWRTVARPAGTSADLQAVVPAKRALVGLVSASGGPTRPAVPLGKIATVHGGTPGYHAVEVSGWLREADAGEVDDTTSRPFVVSRCIDPYRLKSGPVRFLKRRWKRPRLDLTHLSEGKRRLFTQSKVLVPGVCRTLEAVHDVDGVALGVGVYAIVPRSELPVECLVGLLNSAAISRWYRERYPGRELSGGYFGVNAHQLSAVPIPLSWVDDPASTHGLVDLVRQRSRASNAEEQRALDAQIDELVCNALGLAPMS